MSVLLSFNPLYQESLEMVGYMFRQFLSLLFKVFIVLVVGIVVLSIIFARHLLQLVSDITHELLRP